LPAVVIVLGATADHGFCHLQYAMKMGSTFLCKLCLVRCALHFFVLFWYN